MPINPTYPGVYVQEVSSGVRTITGVSTSIAAFVGMVNRGPLAVPTRVLSFSGYERTYGDDTSASEMTDQVKQFFLNGGSQAYIMRIANGAQAAEVTLQNEPGTEEVLDLVARDAGTIGNSVEIVVDYDTSSPESSFNLTAYRLGSDGAGGTEREDEETFTELTMNPASARYAPTIISQQSSLLDVPDDYDPAAANGTAFAGYAIAGRVGTDAFLAGELATAIGVGASADFVLSVDGGPFVTVSIAESAVSGGNLVTPLQNAIDPQLASLGTAVTVSIVNDHLVIASNNGSGGSVQVRQGSTSTVAETLHFGLDRGALEVDGYALARPAPSGVFQNVASDLSDPASVTARLDGLGSNTPAEVQGYLINDDFGNHSETAAFVFDGPTLRDDGSGNESLAQLQSSLDRIVNRIDQDASADANFSWEAQRVGFRILLQPDYGSADTVANTAELQDNGDATAANVTFVLNATAYSLNGSVGRQTNGSPGVDGIAPLPDDYSDAYEIIAREVDLINLLILPRALGSNEQGDTEMAALWGAASVFCKDQRAFLLVDPPSAWSTADNADQNIAALRIGVTTDHAAVYWPQVTVSDNGITKNIAPSGTIAGLMARTDSSRGVWKAPAGTEATLLGVRGLQHAMSDDENGIINPQAVNALRVFPAGVVSWGARTMVGFNNSGNDDYKYVPVRRIALFLAESLYRGLKFAVFEPNDEPLWAQIRLAAGAFMNNLFRQGAFQGSKASDAYFVKCDSESTTQNDINLGIVNVVIGFAPLKPAEFVIITLQQRAGEVTT